MVHWCGSVKAYQHYNFLHFLKFMTKNWRIWPEFNKINELGGTYCVWIFKLVTTFEECALDRFTSSLAENSLLFLILNDSRVNLLLRTSV